MDEHEVMMLTAEDLHCMVMDEGHGSLAGRLVFVEGRPKEGVKWQVFPAFVQEERRAKDGSDRSWVVAIVQRLNGSIEMAKVRIREDALGKLYRIWNGIPSLGALAKAGEWPANGRRWKIFRS